MTVTEKQVMQALKGLGLTEREWEVLTREGAPDDSIKPRPFLMEFAQRIADDARQVAHSSQAQGELSVSPVVTNNDRMNEENQNG